MGMASPAIAVDKVLRRRLGQEAALADRSVRQAHRLRKPSAANFGSHHIGWVHLEVEPRGKVNLPASEVGGAGRAAKVQGPAGDLPVGARLLYYEDDATYRTVRTLSQMDARLYCYVG